MARDETARDSDGDASLLNRRKYLKLAGTAVATTATFGAGNAAGADYETITVSSGQNRTFDLGSGDTLENVLIDVTADGASFQVSASGDGWAIRNVGVKGIHSGSHTGAFWVRGNGTIENVYLGDGDVGKDDGAEVTGVFVDRHHSGEITIDRLNVSHFSDNGVYGSAPGNSDSHNRPGGGGTVKITNSFSEKCGSSGFRIGTRGSYCRNCVTTDGYDRGFWGYYEDTTFENCDAANNRVQWCAGSSSYDKATNANITLKNCSSEGQFEGGACPGSIEGNPDSSPRRTPPEGVPTSAEAAAAGKGGSGGGSSPDKGTVLELVTNDGAPELSYEFTVEGSVQKRTSAGDVKSEANDSVTDNGDGTVTVSGVAGNGYGDSYVVDGTFLSMNLDESKWTIRYGGEQVSVGDLTGPTVDRFEVSKSNTLGDERMFSVKWAVSADSEDLDTVEVSVVEGTDVNFSVTEVGGASASNWDLFQFPVGTSVDVNLRVEDASGTATKETKTVEL